MTRRHWTGRGWRRRWVLAAAMAAVGMAAAPGAQAQGEMVDLQVVDRETGQAAQVWRRAGRLYVGGRPGARYSLRVTNNTGGRVLVVMSVDGVNILTGETAAFGQRGYVFAPYETYDISGWRKSDVEVAAFTFAPLSRSYAARTGRPNDVGVIGVAAFAERRYEPLAVAPAAPEFRSRGNSYSAEDSAQSRGAGAFAPAAPPPPPPSASARAAPAPQMAQRSEKLGTGHGPREWSQVTTVAFERASAYPQFTRQIEYDSRENLIAAGIIPRPRPGPVRPQPFPGNPGGYVPDPPYGR